MLSGRKIRLRAITSQQITDQTDLRLFFRQLEYTLVGLCMFMLNTGIRELYMGMGTAGKPAVTAGKPW